MRSRALEAIAPTPAPAILPASGEVLCLRMEDHYVRVCTPGGSRRWPAGPFERVIAGMTQEGMRVHRSWWVARAAVTGVVADGQDLRLTLRATSTAPVSRGLGGQAARGRLAGARRAGAKNRVIPAATGRRGPASVELGGASRP